MSNKWLAANNVERAYQLLSAINILSINAKLKLLEADVPISKNEIARAEKIFLTSPVSLGL